MKTLSLHSLAAASLAAAALLQAGCATTPKPAPAEPASTSNAPTEAKAKAPEGAGGSIALGSAPAEPIYFDFDSDTIREDSKLTLQQMAKYLADHPNEAVTIEGHCDDLGTADYNLALGDRRARAARDYLARLGVGADRLRSVSFGEEKPAVANDDQGRPKNRRGQFDLKKAG